MNGTLASLGAVLLGLGLAACSASAERSDGLAESRLETGSGDGADCSASCPAVFGSFHQGPVSSARVAVLNYFQVNTCDGAAPPSDPSLHTLRAGDRCWSAASPAHGQPLDGADACEEFVCDAAGALRASACVSPSIESAAPAAALPRGRCASREVACALAREDAAARGHADRLCR